MLTRDEAWAKLTEWTETASLGVELGEHIQFIIDALQPHATELGIGARK